MDATITFVKDDKGNVTHIVIHQGGRDTKAKRLEEHNHAHAAHAEAAAVK